MRQWNPKFYERNIVNAMYLKKKRNEKSNLVFWMFYLERKRNYSFSKTCSEVCPEKTVDAKSLISEETGSLFCMFLSIIIRYLLFFSLIAENKKVTSADIKSLILQTI